MKKFLKRRWHGIPIGIIAVLALAGIVAAASFLTFTTVITVAEPLTIEYNLQGAYGGDSLWHPLGDEDSLTIEGSAGDIFEIDLRINNRANGPVTVNTVITGEKYWFTFTGFPDGNVQASLGDNDDPEWNGTMTLTISGGTPVGEYSVHINFTRS